MAYCADKESRGKAKDKREACLDVAFLVPAVPSNLLALAVDPLALVQRPFQIGMNRRDFFLLINRMLNKGVRQ
jgi:hypothetical protein